MRRPVGNNNFSGPGDGPPRYGQYETLEEENEVMVNELKGKITTLKSISVEIGNEVRKQNSLLSDMDNDFESSGNLLKSSIARVIKLGKAGHWKIWVYMFLFALFVFFILYIFLKFR